MKWILDKSWRVCDFRWSFLSVISNRYVCVAIDIRERHFFHLRFFHINWSNIELRYKSLLLSIQKTMFYTSTWLKNPKKKKFLFKDEINQKTLTLLACFHVRYQVLSFGFNWTDNCFNINWKGVMNFCNMFHFFEKFFCGVTKSIFTRRLGNVQKRRRWMWVGDREIFSGVSFGDERKNKRGMKYKNHQLKMSSRVKWVCVCMRALVDRKYTFRLSTYKRFATWCEK